MSFYLVPNNSSGCKQDHNQDRRLGRSMVQVFLVLFFITLISSIFLKLKFNRGPSSLQSTATIKLDPPISIWNRRVSCFLEVGNKKKIHCLQMWIIFFFKFFYQGYSANSFLPSRVNLIIIKLNLISKITFFSIAYPYDFTLLTTHGFLICYHTAISIRGKKESIHDRRLTSTKKGVLCSIFFV